MKLFGVCLVVFPFKEKGFPRKSLCSYVIVLLLCLLKFIHNYIEFFPTLLYSRKVLAGTYIIHKNFHVWWEELAGWVASFSYHVVCCGLLRGLAPCKVYLYTCDAFAWKRKLKNYTWCEWSILELTLICWRGVPSFHS